jgi:hypothetical protein
MRHPTLVTPRANGFGFTMSKNGDRSKSRGDFDYSRIHWADDASAAGEAEPKRPLKAG